MVLNLGAIDPYDMGTEELMKIPTYFWEGAYLVYDIFARINIEIPSDQSVEPSVPADDNKPAATTEKKAAKSGCNCQAASSGDKSADLFWTALICLMLATFARRKAGEN
jgi:hypothetical protein